MLKQLVNSYMRDQWVNKRRDIGFYAAKEELLRCGEIMFCEPGTYNAKYVFKDEQLEIPYPLPVIADSSGDFGKMYFDGEYSIIVRNKHSVNLLMVTTSDGFDIDA